MTRRNRRHASQKDRRDGYHDNHPFLSWILPFFLFDAFFSGPAMTEASTANWTTDPISNQTERTLPSENTEDISNSHDNFESGHGFDPGDSFDAGNF